MLDYPPLLRRTLEDIMSKQNLNAPEKKKTPTVIRFITSVTNSVQTLKMDFIDGRQAGYYLTGKGQRRPVSARIKKYGYIDFNAAKKLAGYARFLKSSSVYNNAG